MLKRSKWFINFGILSNIFFGCGNDLNSNSLLGNDNFANFENLNSVEEYFEKLNNICLSDFKNKINQENNFSKRDWNNRQREILQKETEANNVKFIDKLPTFINLAKTQIINSKNYIKLPDNPGEFLIQKAEEIGKLENLETQIEYWGNLEFFISCYASELIICIENSDLSDEEKIKKLQEVVDNFYKAYEKAFELISDIKLNFKDMCEIEQDSSFELFHNEKIGTLKIVKGVPINIMESLALLKINPMTGQQATLANLCRGEAVASPKEINSTESCQDNLFLVKFAQSCCNYVREVIGKINEKLICFQIHYSKIAKVQENKVFLLKDFRKINNNMNEFLIFEKMLEKQNGEIYLIENSYVKKEKGKLVFKNDNKFEEENDLLKKILNIDQVKLGQDIVASANNTLKKIKKSQMEEAFPFLLENWQIKDL